LKTFTDDSRGAISITAVEAKGLKAWQKAASASDRAWLKTLGFTAEAGKVAFLPGAGKRQAKVLVGADLKRDPIWALAQQRAVPVEQPLAETLPGLVTTWLYDPDQVTNYFAEIRPRPRPQPQAPATTR